MDSRLKKLAELHEMTRQAMLGANWEELFDLRKILKAVEREIRLCHMTQKESV